MLKKLYYTPNLTFFSADYSTVLELPFTGSIKAGFPSPADDFLDNSIDLNKHLIKNPSTTFFAKVSGNSMEDVGISDGDLLIIDKGLEPKNNNIAVCFVDGDFTVKRIKIEKDTVLLIAENRDYKPIKVTNENELIIWGIVINIIKFY